MAVEPAKLKVRSLSHKLSLRPGDDPARLRRGVHTGSGVDVHGEVTIAGVVLPPGAALAALLKPRGVPPRGTSLAEGVYLSGLDLLAGGRALGSTSPKAEHKQASSEKAGDVGCGKTASVAGAQLEAGPVQAVTAAAPPPPRSDGKEAADAGSQRSRCDPGSLGGAGVMPSPSQPRAPPQQQLPASPRSPPEPVQSNASTAVLLSPGSLPLGGAASPARRGPLLGGGASLLQSSLGRAAAAVPGGGYPYSSSPLSIDALDVEVIHFKVPVIETVLTQSQPLPSARASPPEPQADAQQAPSAPSSQQQLPAKGDKASDSQPQPRRGAKSSGSGVAPTAATAPGGDGSSSRSSSSSSGGSGNSGSDPVAVAPAARPGPTKALAPAASSSSPVAGAAVSASPAAALSITAPGTRTAGGSPYGRLSSDSEGDAGGWISVTREGRGGGGSASGRGTPAGGRSSQRAGGGGTTDEGGAGSGGGGGRGTPRRPAASGSPGSPVLERSSPISRPRTPASPSGLASASDGTGRPPSSRAAGGSSSPLPGSPVAAGKRTGGGGGGSAAASAASGYSSSGTVGGASSSREQPAATSQPQPLRGPGSLHPLRRSVLRHDSVGSSGACSDPRELGPGGGAGSGTERGTTTPPRSPAAAPDGRGSRGDGPEPVTAAGVLLPSPASPGGAGTLRKALAKAAVAKATSTSASSSASVGASPWRQGSPSRPASAPGTPVSPASPGSDAVQSTPAPSPPTGTAPAPAPPVPAPQPSAHPSSAAAVAAVLASAPLPDLAALTPFGSAAGGGAPVSALPSVMSGGPLPPLVAVAAAGAETGSPSSPFLAPLAFPSTAFQFPLFFSGASASGSASPSLPPPALTAPFSELELGGATSLSALLSGLGTTSHSRSPVPLRGSFGSAGSPFAAGSGAEGGGGEGGGGDEEDGYEEDDEGEEGAAAATAISVALAASRGSRYGSRAGAAGAAAALAGGSDSDGYEEDDEGDL